MPLFGHKNKTHAGDATRHHQATNTTSGPLATDYAQTGRAYSGTGTGTGTGAGYGSAGAGMVGSGYNDPSHGSDSTFTHHGGTAVGNDLYPSTNTTGYNQTNIPPTNTLSHGPGESHGGAGQRMTGKVEQAVGSMVGSNALKAKGLEKEREANSMKLQSRELAEAERLEREAALRRERAVAHGAHPDNKHLGGAPPGSF